MSSFSLKTMIASALPAHGSLEVIELPAGITPTMLGITVGTVTAVVVFAIIAFIFTARGRRSAAAASDVVVVAPYSTYGSPDMTRPPPAQPVQYARMGFAFGQRIGAPASPAPRAPMATPVMETTAVAPPRIEAPPAVQVSPVVMISAPPRSEDSAPHPLGVIPASSSAMLRAAPISELSYEDDGPTEFCEPYFEEPPQPVSRSGR